jgi:hypothetical protein
MGAAVLPDEASPRIDNADVVVAVQTVECMESIEETSQVVLEEARGVGYREDYGRGGHA